MEIIETFEQGPYTNEDYWATSEDKNVELIEGHFYNMAPPSRIHQKITTEIVTIINNYIKANSGKCEVYPAPFAVKLNDKTVIEPDISVICDKDKLDNRGCNGSPDFIAEIVSPSNPSNDYIKKLGLYQHYGVREYWIVNPMRKTVLVYFFENDVAPISYTFEEAIKVNIYDDLYICLKDVD